MSAFVAMASLMVVAALVVILRPLLSRPGVAANRRAAVSRAQEALADLHQRREKGELSATAFEEARSGLALELLNSVEPAADHGGPRNTRGNLLSAAVIAVLVPATAVTLYLKLGASELLSVSPVVADASNPPAAGEPAPPVEVLLERLLARLEDNPEDVKGWEILARSYLQTGRFAEARDAYGKLYELVGDRPEVMVGYAEALARVANGELAGRPLELLEAALRIDGSNQQGLWLAGLAAVQKGDKETAKSYWRRLLELQEPGSEAAGTLETHIAELNTGDDATTPAQPLAKTAPQEETPEPALNGASLLASVSLDPSLRNQVNADDTLFVYARASNGARMPIALARHRASELPISVRLDDSMAMMPQLKLSNFADVEVVARISRTGQAAQQSGDLIGTSGAVAVGSAESVAITISRIVP